MQQFMVRSTKYNDCYFSCVQLNHVVLSFRSDQYSEYILMLIDFYCSKLQHSQYGQCSYEQLCLHPLDCEFNVFLLPISLFQLCRLCQKERHIHLKCHLSQFPWILFWVCKERILYLCSLRWTCFELRKDEALSFKNHVFQMY